MRTGKFEPSASGVSSVGTEENAYASGVFDNIRAASGVFEYVYGDGSNLTGVSTGGSTGFGSWESIVSGDTYQAETDGFVIAVTAASSTDPNVQVLSDTTSPPTTLVGNFTPYDNSGRDTITIPIKRGNYYKANKISGTVSLYWMSIGDIGSATAGGLGAWESKTDSTAYQAATDGFVVASRSSNGWLYGFTDSSSSPTTYRAQSKTHTTYDSYGSITFPVKSGDYWKTTGADAYLFWIPISYGSGGTGTTLPVGSIILWYGAIANIPSGWALCDGNNGTPNLVDKFVICAKQDDGGTPKTNVTGSLTQTGGEATHTLTIDEMPAHTHNTYVGSPYGAGYPTGQVGNPTPAAATTSTGGGAAHNTLPPYYALAYIMRVL